LKLCEKIKFVATFEKFEIVFGIRVGEANEIIVFAIICRNWWIVADLFGEVFEVFVEEFEGFADDGIEGF
jgi:hypothetical protein